MAFYDRELSWSGRNDGPGAEHARWHSRVTPVGEFAGAALLGFASDEGVERNGGRRGAAQGPQEIRKALGSLALHDENPRYDAGTVIVDDDNLEHGHELLAEKVAGLVSGGNLPIILGGGHETAFGSHMGLLKGLSASDGDPKIAIINLDAHFDLRANDVATSGTPFKQIADHRPHQFNYSVVGISVPNNTKVLFDTAHELGVTIITDEEVLDLNRIQIGEKMRELTEGADYIHLSIDLDVLPAAQAPGVSAPAALGVPLEKIHAAAMALAETGKLALVDVVELNPKYDIDGRTAKLAARLISDIITIYLTRQ